MGKQGPCYHCGVTSTPLWRNGPPEKPILCNACGSRWRTKGTLANYTPLHAREEPIDSVDFKVSKVKNIYIKTKDQKFRKPKQCNYDVKVEAKAPHCDQNFRKVLEEDTSNRSSSGSATSYSESCAQFGSIDASDLTGSEQSNVWDTFPPLRKRTSIKRPKKPSPVEKLTKDLCSILHEQQSSYLSRSTEDDLLFESETSMVPDEIGHGGVLIRRPNSASQEEESEASSLPINNQNQIVNDDYSGSAYLPIHLERKGISPPTVSLEKVKTLTAVGAQEHTKRDKFSHEKFHTLQNSNSPLIPIDLRDVANFEEFTRHLTCEEQQQLMKNLPSIDTTKLPDSLKSMFDSHQFAETLFSFQQLLREGIFDNSFLGANTEECRTLKRLVLANFTKSNWVEQYKLLKDVKHKQITRGKGVVSGSIFHGPGNLGSIKRSRNDQNPEVNGTAKFPKRVHKSGTANIPSVRSPELNFSDVGYDHKDFMDSDGSCFSPRTLFAYPPDLISVTLDSLEFTNDISNQDLLIDVPSNASFPEAELLDSRLYKQKKALPYCSVTKSEVSDENLSSSFSSQRSSTSSSLIYPLGLP